MDGLYQIPNGLSPEAEKLLRSLIEKNISLTNQIQQARGVLKETLEPERNPKIVEKENETSATSNLLRKAKVKKNGKVQKPVDAIRENCFQCQGWHGEGERRPKKKVRECENTGCPLHPFRMGKNPNMARN
jgi:hypothetical protein